MNELPVEVIRSTRRRKTVSAEIRQGVLVVRIPSRMSRREEREWVDKMRVRLVERVPDTSDEALASRASTLAKDFDLPLPTSIRWGRQERRWGSATPLDGSVRISTRLQGEPEWVLDYVLVHELAHLEIPDHSSEFWDLVARYPLMERARGFLISRETPLPDSH